MKIPSPTEILAAFDGKQLQSLTTDVAAALDAYAVSAWAVLAPLNCCKVVSVNHLGAINNRPVQTVKTKGRVLDGDTIVKDVKYANGWVTFLRQVIDEELDILGRDIAKNRHLVYFVAPPHVYVKREAYMIEIHVWYEYKVLARELLL